MSNKEILEKAKALIKDPSNWTRYTYKAYVCGATAYCAMGAIEQVIGFDRGFDHVNQYVDERDAQRQELLFLLDNAAQDLYGNCGVVYVNDKKNHSDVMAVFDKAIADA